MFPDSTQHEAEPAPDHAPNLAVRSVISTGDPGRVDLVRVMAALRQLPGSPDPGRVFAELAATCVPAMCDEIVIGIDELDGRRQRIRRPDTATLPWERSVRPAAPGMAVITGRSVTVRVTSLPDGGPKYTARLACSWRPGYLPSNTDAALVGVVANYGVAVVHRERTRLQVRASDAPAAGSPRTRRRI